MYTQHIILDFEMNPIAKGNKAVSKYLKREIIEIGAVKLNAGYGVVDRYKCLVKPQFNSDIMTFITGLTGICTADVSRSLSFDKALKEFEEWIGYTEKTRIYSWGISDLDQIKRECVYKDVTMPDNMKRWMNIQALYPRIMGLSKDYYQLALHTAAEQFGFIMDSKQCHSALYDAEITTEIVVSILTKEYKKQSDILRQLDKREYEQITCTLGESCESIFQQLLLQLQPELIG
ncbi:MAG: exonuclease domain-containing protein [Lachnospiraceae bacterium]|nr:exonuclease domain-containing protein [Lachnospiraceae bacterium]